MRKVSPSLAYFLLVPILTATLFASVWVYTLRQRDAFLDSDYGQWTAKLHMVKACHIGDIVIIGDSRASAAFVPSRLGMQITNLALSGSTPVEAYYELRDILACTRKPSAVVIAFSPPQYQHIDWLWQHAVRYGQLGTLELNEIADFDRRFPSHQLYHANFGAEPAPATKNWLYANHFPPYDFASLIAAGLSMRRKANQVVEAETFSASGHHVIGTPAKCADDSGIEANVKHFIPDPLIDLYFKRILKDLEANKIAIVISNPPYNIVTARELQDSFKSEFQEYIRKSSTGYAHLEIEEPLFKSLPSCFFGDRHHLNENGAVLFSEAEGPLLRRSISEAVSKK